MGSVCCTEPGGRVVEHIPGGEGDPLRGLSVHFLSTTLIQYLNDKGFTADACVYEVEEKVIRSMSQAKVCPRDGRQGSAFVDVVKGEDNVGRSVFMLSYTWGYKFRDIIEALVAYCKDNNLDPKKSYVWMCCFCINQHRVKEAQQRGDIVSFDEFASEFGSRVKGIGHVLALMAPWNGPAYLKRVWCVYEVYKATSDADVKLDIIMPPEEVNGFVCYAEDTSWGVNKCVLWESFKKVRVENAVASVDQDRKNILALIEDSCGPFSVNQKVMHKLQVWVAEICWGKAHSLLDGSDVELGALASARVARFFVELGQPEKALQLLAKGQERLDNAGVELSVAKAAIKTIMGFVKQQLHDFDGAFADLQDAYRIRQAAKALDTSDAAELLECLGVAQAKRGDLLAAKEKLAHATSTRLATNTHDSPDGAGLLANMGLLCAILDDFEGAKTSFDKAQRIRVATGTLDTPRGGHMLAMKALVEGMQGQRDAALKLCNEAHLILEAVTASHTKRGADILMVMAFVLAKADEPAKLNEALANYSSALAILEKLKVSDNSRTSWAQPSDIRRSVSDQADHIKDQMLSKEFLATLLE